MMSDMKKLNEARLELRGSVRCVAYNENGLHTSNEKGLLPLINWLEGDPDFLRGASVADKVVGRAAAMIMVYAGVCEVYASVISDAALELLKSEGIACTYSMTCIAISNRRGDGICPMERAVSRIRDPKEAFEVLKEKVLSN